MAAPIAEHEMVGDNMTRVIIRVGGSGTFHEGFEFELCRCRWGWWARQRAKWHLAKYPFRAARFEEDE